MKYAMLIHTSPATRRAGRGGATGRCSPSTWRSRGPARVGGAQLQPVETATTVRVQDGQTLTTDGPFADTKEVFGGYYVFEADNLDEAIELAARIPAARLGGAIEVRPLVER